jgi:hypothetical protein
MEEDDSMIAQAVRVEEHQFQAETTWLLDLMIHSLYTNFELLAGQHYEDLLTSLTGH